MVASEGDQCWLHHHDNTANFNKHLLDKVSVSVSVNTVVTEADLGHWSAVSRTASRRSGGRTRCGRWSPGSSAPGRQTSRRRTATPGTESRTDLQTVYTYKTYTGAKVDVNKWNNIRKRVYGDTFINGSLNYAVSPVSPPEIGACMLCAFSKYYREILLAPWHLFPSCLVPCRVGGDSARSKWRDRYRGHPPVSNGQTDTKVRLESGKNNKTSLW